MWRGPIRSVALPSSSSKRERDSHEGLAAERATYRFPSAERPQSEWNLKRATGTELLRHKEKFAEFPRNRRISERLWSLDRNLFAEWRHNPGVSGRYL